MSEANRRIEEFLSEAAGHFAGSRADHQSALDELRDLLESAAEHGELESRLAAIGSPLQAASSFGADRTRPLARIPDRWLAALIDNSPLLIVSVLLFLRGFSEGSTTFTFPPFAYLAVADGCVALVPPCPVYPPGPEKAIALPLALLWSVVGLALVESRWGTTPGKRLLGLKVVTGEGIRLRIHAALLRRASFLLGPVAWLDWVPALWGDHRRVLDRAADARVVSLKPVTASQQAGPDVRYEG
jgi:uncharacterized RDD family membrane protein YckC